MVAPNSGSTICVPAPPRTVKPASVQAGPSPLRALTVLCSRENWTLASIVVTAAPPVLASRTSLPRKSTSSGYAPGSTSTLSPLFVAGCESAYWMLA